MANSTCISMILLDTFNEMRGFFICYKWVPYYLSLKNQMDCFLIMYKMHVCLLIHILKMQQFQNSVAGVHEVYSPCRIYFRVLKLYFYSVFHAGFPGVPIQIIMVRKKIGRLIWKKPPEKTRPYIYMYQSF